MLLPALGVNVLLASAAFLVAKRTVSEFPPLALAQIRFVLAAGLMWPLVRLMGPKVEIAPEDRGRMWLLGLLAVPLNQGLFLLGMQWASASHGALLYALSPALVVLILAVGRGTRPTHSQILGVVLAFAGVLLLLLQRGLHFDRHSVRGDLVIFGAVVAWGFYFVLGRAPTRRYGALVVTGEALFTGTIIFLPVGIVALTRFHPETVSRTAWLGLFYLAWITSVLNYAVWFWGLQYLKTPTVAMLTNLQPIVTAALAWVFLHESLPPGFLLSTALVIAGVWLTRYGAEPS